MPFYGLCNRLDVTSTHQSSDSQAWCLRTSDLGFTRRPVTHAPACAGHDEIHVDAGLPLPEGTDPKWRCGWAPQSPATSQSVLPMMRLPALAQTRDPSVLVRQRASRTGGPLTFPVALPLALHEVGTEPQHRGPILSRCANTARL